MSPSQNILSAPQHRAEALEATEEARPLGGTDRLVHLHSSGVSLVLDCRGPGLPVVLHWGSALGETSAADLEALALTAVPGVVASTPDAPALVSLVPENASGWSGLPGLRGHRDGRDWSASFAIEAVHLSAPGGVGLLTVLARDVAAGLGLELRVELVPSGLVRMQAELQNSHAALSYTLDGLTLTLPVPPAAAELLDLTGRWSRERSPQRRPFGIGAWLRDGRRGRTGADATLVLVAGEPGFDFGSGQVWGLHVAWSGNHRTYAERLPTAESVLGGGELLLPGEVRLAPQGRYETPWVYGSYGEGLDRLAARFHQFLRARPNHPQNPRLVVMNTWEAVYFDHDLDRLRELADLGAQVGAERYVLDDGWFRHRRDDHAGLGDWYVDEQRWPDGLHPLVDHVRGLGMEFGLWVEPEMVNPDSDLARAHPEWILATGGRQPPLSRFQQVLDLGHPAAYDYILERLDALLSEYHISYLKWDHNRDLIDAGHQPGGEPGVHGQTTAVYRLLDELRARHPGLEIESCSSGGSRVDLGILERTDRVWASDCIDALERQTIQRWTGLLLPPELIGSHVGAARAHSTGRTHDLSFRAGTALFGHFGIEWDIASATPQERAELTEWVALYKRMRQLLHSGTVVRAQHPDPALWVHGVVSADSTEAVFAVVAVASSAFSPLGRVPLPGLSPDARYCVQPLPPGDAPSTVGPPPPWMAAGECVLTGHSLGSVGLQLPTLHPDQLFLLHLAAVRPGEPQPFGE